MRKPKTKREQRESKMFKIGDAADYCYTHYDIIIGTDTIRWWIKRGLKKRGLGKDQVPRKLQAMKLGDTWYIDKEDFVNFLNEYKIN